MKATASRPSGLSKRPTGRPRSEKTRKAILKAAFRLLKRNGFDRCLRTADRRRSRRQHRNALSLVGQQAVHPARCLPRNHTRHPASRKTRQPPRPAAHLHTAHRRVSQERQRHAYFCACCQRFRKILRCAKAFMKTSFFPAAQRAAPSCRMRSTRASFLTASNLTSSSIS